MTAGWVASSTRGRALLRRTVGSTLARSIAESDAWPPARTVLSNTAVGSDMPATADRAAARRAATVATAWQLRVLAGWLPPASSGMVRAFAAPLEIANIESQLEQVTHGTSASSIPLGTLGVAWPSVRRARTADELRTLLARSAWGDPGGVDRTTVALGLRVAWARRLARQTRLAAAWAHGGAALLAARERLAFDRGIAEPTSRELDRLLGTGWRRASTPAEFAERLPTVAWVFDEVTTTDDLWRGEVAIVRRVAEDARRVADGARNGRDTIVSVMALLLVDLWQVHAAIEAAGRTPIPLLR